MKLMQFGSFTSILLAVTSVYGYDAMQTTEPPDVSSNASTGLSTNQESRIYGGLEADVDKYPFIASLRFDPFGKTFCGGTLVAPQYILTAGHCIKTDKGQLYVSLGSQFSAGAGSGSAEKIKVVEGYRHPLYNNDNHLYDVGLLKLEKSSTQKTSPLCADDGSDNKVGTMATVLDGSDNKVGTMGTVLGWGKTQTSGESTSPTLQQITLPVISNAECGKFKKYVGRVTEGMLCAGTGNNKDTCNGDSGGPLLVDDDILIGCVSWGSKCGQQAGIFTRLTYVMDYIEDILAGGDGSKFKGSSSGSMDGVILPPSSDSSSSDDLMSILQGSGSNDLSWLLDLLKSNSGSGSNDLSWLFDSNSDSDSASGSEDTKGGKATKAPIEESSESAESDSGSEDAVLVKGGKTSKKTKSSKTLVEEDSDSASEDSAIQSDSVHQSDQVTQQSFK
ncbi:P-type ATPase (P-ATPase) Superfamily [Phytophthora nicotianae]|uniref:P-type ATPase (P-ATPase) Superfamily n=1 Tax=Phytophthora nicotianae TaxID=4792 RepID=A0A0W8DGP6_PHYNI|nr:P-type ATPase (P-ATPase) Superfamily [Phytophthora nicotianae]